LEPLELLERKTIVHEHDHGSFFTPTNTVSSSHEHGFFPTTITSVHLSFPARYLFLCPFAFILSRSIHDRLPPAAGGDHAQARRGEYPRRLPHGGGSRKERLASYGEATLLEVGCERTKPKDKFWLECKKEEVQ